MDGWMSEVAALSGLARCIANTNFRHVSLSSLSNDACQVYSFLSDYLFKIRD